jgi:branched-chain amino acid transport system ATP-binding protein
LESLISAQGLSAGYDGHAVVRNLSLEVRAGEILAILGPNGAGKTTTLLTLSGELAPVGGMLKVDGRVSKQPLHRRAARGLSFVTEERSVFMGLSVADNLRLGRCAVDLSVELFPELAPLMKRTAGLLSGGEQQMLTLARALSRRPRVLLADELSLGLAPLVVVRLLRAVRDAADRGVGVVLVEQHVSQVMKIADRVCVLRQGDVVLHGTRNEAAGRLTDIQASYLASPPPSPRGSASPDGTPPTAQSRRPR